MSECRRHDIEHCDGSQDFTFARRRAEAYLLGIPRNRATRSGTSSRMIIRFAPFGEIARSPLSQSARRSCGRYHCSVIFSRERTLDERSLLQTTDRWPPLMKSMRIHAVPLLMLSAGACVPVRVWDMPRLSGQIRRGAAPVVGATVSWVDLSVQANGRQLVGSGRTDSQGEFEINGVDHHSWAPLLPVHSLAKWQVDLQEGELRVVLWRQNLYKAGPRSTPGRVRVNCDLAVELPCTIVETDAQRLRMSGRLPVDEPLAPRAPAVEQ